MNGYLSIPEVSEKWGVSERLVNQYCNQGKIPGAERFGRSWAIPEDAERPLDSRRDRVKSADRTLIDPEVRKDTELAILEAESPEAKVRRPFEEGRFPMPLLNMAFEPGHCREAVDSIEDPEFRKLAMGEYYYFSGRAEEASAEVEPFLNHTNMTLRLSSNLIYAFANLSTGQTRKTRAALGEMQTTLRSIDDTVPRHLKALAGFIALGGSVLLHLPLPPGLPSTREYLALLPPGLRYFALYLQAHHAYLQEDYSGSIAVAETALALQTEPHPIVNIYLHMVATMDYMGMREPEKAKEHMMAAWELARADDLIQPLGEHHGLLGGMLEATIKWDSPEEFKRIIAITYRFSAGWRRIHNPDTGHDVADNLTTTEFATAMLAARDWTNQEIADHMGISANTVKRYISTALQKLNITQRKELKQYMLR